MAPDLRFCPHRWLPLVPELHRRRSSDPESFLRTESRVLEGSWRASIRGRTGGTRPAGGQVHRPSAATQCETYFRLHAYPTLRRRPIGAIRRSEIQAWVKKLSKNLAPGSVEFAYRRVITIFEAAVGDRLIAASPCIRIALPNKLDTQ